MDDTSGTKFGWAPKSLILLLLPLSLLLLCFNTKIQKKKHLLEFDVGGF